MYYLYLVLYHLLDPRKAIGIGAIVLAGACASLPVSQILPVLETSKGIFNLFSDDKYSDEVAISCTDNGNIRVRQHSTH